MPTDAAVHVLNETHILLFLVQFLLLLGAAKLLGMVFVRFRQPTVTADILVGMLLGPSVFGRLAPSLQAMIFPAESVQVAMLDTVAWLGILFLLLVTGLEVNLASVWRQKGKATWIALSDIIIPIVISAAVLYFLPARYLIDPNRRLLFTVFLGTIMTISAMPVSIRVMADLRLLRTDLGFLTVSALSINDIIGWVVFTIILGIFSYGSPDVLFVGTLVLYTGLFLLLALTVGRRLVDNTVTAIHRRAADSSGYALTVVCLSGLAFGVVTQAIGIHALFGFFVAGLIAGEARDLSEATRTTITRIVYAVFVPIFFANIGLKIDIVESFDVLLVTVFTVLGIVARFAGAYAGVVFSRAPREQRWPVAALHTPGGEMHIVIGTLALELGLITNTVFVAIVVAAVLSSVTLGPWLSAILKRMVTREALQLSPALSLELAPTDKYTALRQLSSKAAEALKYGVDDVYEVARTREEAMSTALEQGIAIPHARLEQAAHPVVVYGRARTGIDWNSSDGVPARHAFFIVTPVSEVDVQLRIYRQLTRVLFDETVRERLLQAPTPAQACEALNEQLRDAYVRAL